MAPLTDAIARVKAAAAARATAREKGKKANEPKPVQVPSGSAAPSATELSTPAPVTPSYDTPSDHVPE